jgi:hypothetical protein
VIIVPAGHHIKLTYEHMDIAESEDCAEDSLSVAQDHQSRDFDPMMNYYFYYDHEEVMRTNCGIVAPDPLITEANQIRINFTTNEKTTGKGFKLSWEAECGTTFKMNHGVVSAGKKF